MAGRKKKERAEHLRGLNDEALDKELTETYRRLFSVRLQLTTRQQSNTREKSNITRQIARIRTLQRERQLAVHYAPQLAERK